MGREANKHGMGRLIMEDPSDDAVRVSWRKRVIAIVVCIVTAVAVAGYALWYLDTLSFSDGSGPSLRLVQDEVSIWSFTIRDPIPENTISWDDVVIRLDATPTDPESSFTYAYWVWQPNQEALSSSDGEDVSQSVNSSYVHASRMIVCNLTDVVGNGLMNDGDRFTLILVGDDVDLTGVPCQLTVKWIGEQGIMGSLNFTP